jgi:adenylate cyclase
MTRETTTCDKPQVSPRVGQAAARDAARGLRHGLWTRVALTVAAGLWVSITVPFPAALFYLALAVLFIVNGLARQGVVERFPARHWPAYLFIVLDTGLLVTALLYPNPLLETPIPRQMMLRQGTFPLFYVFLAGTMLAYSRRQLIWTGIAVALAWGGAAWWTSRLPGTLTPADFPAWRDMPPAARLQISDSPHFIDTAAILLDIFLFLTVTAILALVVWRVRHLAVRQADMDTQRANLARYFSPTIVEELTNARSALDEEIVQHAAVMFVDIHGFTAMAEQLPPKQTLEFLRSFHSRMSREVFDHGGTLDKFIGDGLMATFGAPRKSPQDATNAIACALAMRASIEEWNEVRSRIEYIPIKIGIGIHYGPVIMGDIGSEERLEFAVIGDTVNVASRLETLSRELETTIVLSDDVMAAAYAQADLDDPLFNGFREVTEQEIRGRLTGTIVWIYNDRLAAEDADRRLKAVDLAPGPP